MNLFLDCDIRGIYGQNVDETLARKIGLAVGSLARRRQVLIAGDYRVHTPQLMDALVEGVIDAGCRALVAGLVPTPVYYFGRKHLRVDTGVMVTASHNPPEYAGFKPILGPLPITPAEIRSIRSLVEKPPAAPGGGSETRVDLVSPYRWWVRDITRRPLELALRVVAEGAYRDTETGLRIVVDCGNGCFGPIAPGLIEEMGYRCIPLFTEPDGRFPNRPSNVALEVGRTAAIAAVIENGADFGVAYDGDGDRVAFVDNRGRSIPNDVVIALLAEDALVGRRGAKIVYDIKCSQIVPEAVRRAGGVPVGRKSGHTFMKTTMIREHAAFGGELSGHLFFPELGGGDDALYATVRMATLILRRGTDLATLVDRVPRYVTTPDLRIPWAASRRELIQAVRRSLEAQEGVAISDVDGVRADFGDGWGLIRVSVTEPIVTLRFEARSAEHLSTIMERFLSGAPELREKVLAAAEDVLGGPTG